MSRENTKKALEEAKKQVAEMLPFVDSISAKQAREIIQRYVAAIEGNFTSWMGATAVSARTLQGRFAAGENLYAEMKERHQELLHLFALAANALPVAQSFEAVHLEVVSMREMVGEMNGLKNITAMAVLESTSEIFIPLLASLA